MSPTIAASDLATDVRLPAAERRFVFHDASEYYDRGWSVIPLVGKRPAIVAWGKYQSRRAVLAQLRTWFADSSANIGIVTGKLSGVVVVDCDTPEDACYWQRHFPSSPLMVRTGGGGEHFYYRYPQGETIGNRVRLLSRQIDLRAEGGYVVAPPSQHPSGERYQWESARDYCLDKVPYFSVEWIENDSAKAGEPVLRTTVHRPRAYLRSIHAVSGQGGHNQTFRAACVLRDAGLSPEEALCEMVLWNETNALPPWSARELLHKVQSAFQKRTLETGAPPHE